MQIGLLGEQEQVGGNNTPELTTNSQTLRPYRQVQVQYKYQYHSLDILRKPESYVHVARYRLPIVLYPRLPETRPAWPGLTC